MRSDRLCLALPLLALIAGCTDLCVRNSDCQAGLQCQAGLCAAPVPEGAADLPPQDLAAPQDLLPPQDLADDGPAAD